MKFFIFSWNTQSIRLYESLHEGIVKLNRQDKTTTFLYNGEYANFLPQLLSKIEKSEADIVIFCFQEDVYPGNYFDLLLKQELSNLHYDFYKSQRLLGVGKTTLKNLSNYDVTMRGLSTMVFIKDLVNFEDNSPFERYIPKFWYKSIMRNKGGMCMYITFGNSTLAIINSHLQFDASNLTDSVIHQDLMLRQDSLNKQNELFNEIYRNFILNTSIPNLSCIFVGDLNYRFIPVCNWSATRTFGEIFRLLNHFYFENNNDDETEQEKDEYKRMFHEFVLKNDEYEQQRAKKNIYLLDEGVNNEGVFFPPTCKLNKKRETSEISMKSYKYGKTDQRVPSWCDRILYKNIRCLKYDIFDVGNIKLSDHLALIGIFDF